VIILQVLTLQITKMISNFKKYLLVFVLFFAASSCQKDPVVDPVIVEPIQIYTDNTFNINSLPEINLQISLEEWNKLLTNYDLNPKNEKKVKANFTFILDGDTTNLNTIGIKLRGNTSRRRPEGVFGETHNATNPDWNHCHFGLDFSKYIDNQNFKGLDKMILKWFKDDGNYVREIYSYDLFEKYGVWTAPQASYCRLKIHVAGDSNPAYYGVYAMIEQVDEVYIKKRSKFWNSNIGFMWKGGWSGSDNANFVSTQSIGVEEVELDPSLSKYYAYDLKTRTDELAAAKTQLINFIYDLNNKTGDEFKNWISSTLDVDLFLKTYAVNVMAGMWDDYWVNSNNFYFYFAANNKAYFIPYDYDNSLGTSLILNNSGTQNPLYWGPSSGKPLINKILAIDEFKEKYKKYIKELASEKNNYLNLTASLNRIVQWQNLIRPYISNDTGEDMILEDKPAFWANCPQYRLLTGNDEGGATGDANYFLTRIKNIPF
jgi:spore coat protein H